MADFREYEGKNQKIANEDAVKVGISRYHRHAAIGEALAWGAPTEVLNKETRYPTAPMQRVNKLACDTG